MKTDAILADLVNREVVFGAADEGRPSELVFTIATHVRVPDGAVPAGDQQALAVWLADALLNASPHVTHEVLIGDG